MAKCRQTSLLLKYEEVVAPETCFKFLLTRTQIDFGTNLNGIQNGLDSKGSYFKFIERVNYYQLYNVILYICFHVLDALTKNVSPC